MQGVARLLPLRKLSQLGIARCWDGPAVASWRGQGANSGIHHYSVGARSRLEDSKQQWQMEGSVVERMYRSFSLQAGPRTFKRKESSVSAAMEGDFSQEGEGVAVADVLLSSKDVLSPPPSARRVGDSPVILKALSFTEMEDWVESIGEPRRRAAVLWKWLYRRELWVRSAGEMEGVSVSFRRKLEALGQFDVLELEDIKEAADGTRKLLFRLQDGAVVETVVIPSLTGRTTVCVSSQVGCALNCQFCFTGRMGLKRHLTSAEIVDQLVFALRLFHRDMGPINNIVFMGMGEPLHNVDNVIKAAATMTDPQGLHFSHRKVTVSTSGLVPQIRRFCRESTCSLAVSLNATTDEVRSWIMPINRKYNLETLLGALREEFPRPAQQFVLFEYVMLKGVNDTVEDAQRLVELVKGIPCKINLIHFNSHSGTEFRPSPTEQVLAFHKVVADSGLVVNIRHSRGDEQMAACGQLGRPGDIQPPRMKPPSQLRTALV